MTNLFDDFDPKFKPGADTFKPVALAFDGSKSDDTFSISIDVQDYIDDAVRKLRNSVASQIETSLQALLKVAFVDVVGRHTDCFDAGDVEEMWRDFLGLLSIAASDAVNVSEDRR